MIAITFHFDAHRYHATQWGRHVNEGVPEWPPSPWRILRTLVAVWRRTLPDLPASEVAPILEHLAAPPSFHLPPAVPAHTRHYMPIQEGRNVNKTLVLDSFVATQPGEPLVAIWPQVVLTPQQQTTLSAILDNLSYLGRGEAWCTAALTDSPPEPNCQPLDSPVLPSGDVDLVRVLVPRQPLKLRDLCAETSELRRQGRIDPPGAEWRLYSRPADCFTPQYRPESTPTRAPEQRPTVVRYALSGPVLPLLTDTLRIAELMRRSAMSRYGRYNNEAASPTLSGKDSSGEFLKGHPHAFYLPTDEDQDGWLDHLTVWAPAGLNSREVDALARVDALNAGQGRPEVRLALLGYGTLKDFIEPGRGHPVFGPATKWRSITPFLLNRHPKLRKGSPAEGTNLKVLDGVTDQLVLELNRRRELEHHSALYEAAELLPPVLQEGEPIHLRGHRALYPLEFYRWRRQGNDPAVGGAYVFQLNFSSPVKGPLALGYACHFGLGLFIPIDSEEV